MDVARVRSGRNALEVAETSDSEGEPDNVHKNARLSRTVESEIVRQVESGQRAKLESG